MKRLKKLSIIAFSIIVGTSIGYYFVETAQLQNQVKKAELQLDLQEKLVNYLEAIDSVYIKTNNNTYSKNFSRSIISTVLIDIEQLTKEEDTSPFSIAKKLIVKDYLAHQKLKLEHDRLQKLLMLYETDYLPCTFKNIDYSYIMDKIHNAEKITLKELKKYGVTYHYTNKSKSDNYFLTGNSNDDRRMLIIKNWGEKQITGHFIFRNKTKTIKTFHSGMKGDSCFKMFSKLYENGELEVTEIDCKKSKKVIKRFEL